MATRFIRLAGVLGVLMPILTLVLVFVAVALSPWFDWHANALSDIGISSTASLFNATLLIGGMLHLVFAIGFVRWRGVASRLAKIAAFFLLLGGVGLLLIGIFTEDAGRIHYVVAATYFLATPLAFVLFGADMLNRGERLPGALSLVAGVSVLLMIVVVPHKGWAVPEILAAVIIGAWTLSFGVQLLLEPRSSHGQTESTI